MVYGSDLFAYDFASALALSEGVLPRRAVPTLAVFVRQAKRFGVECVYETALIGVRGCLMLRSARSMVSCRASTRSASGCSRMTQGASLIPTSSVLPRRLPVARVALRSASRRVTSIGAPQRV